MKRFYQIFLDPNTGNKVIFDDEEGISVGNIGLSDSVQYTIQHNLGTTAIICNIYKDNSLIVPDKIKIVDLNTIEIYISTIEHITAFIIS